MSHIYAPTPRDPRIDSGVDETGDAIPAPSLHNQHIVDKLRQANVEIAHLKTGLAGRTVIGEAIGITMIRMSSTADAAFTHLVHRSQHTNIKIRDLAQRIVDAANGQARDNT